METSYQQKSTKTYSDQQHPSNRFTVRIVNDKRGRGLQVTFKLPNFTGAYNIGSVHETLEEAQMFSDEVSRFYYFMEFRKITASYFIQAFEKRTFWGYLGSREDWDNTYKLLQRFRPDLVWEDIDKNFITEFREWMLNTALKKDGTGYNSNYFIQQYRILLYVMKTAIQDGFIRTRNNPIEGMRFRDKNPVERVYLTQQELKQLERVKLEEGSRMDVIRIRFLIGAYTGARYSDFSNFSIKNIQNGSLKYMAQKTGAVITVPVHPYVIKQMMLGIPDIKAKNTLSEVAIFDKEIKLICHKAGITSTDIYFSNRSGTQAEQVKEKWCLVSSHTARRSFATNLVIEGASLDYVRDLLGHSSVSVTERYVLCDTSKFVDRYKKFNFFKGEMTSTKPERPEPEQSKEEAVSFGKDAFYYGERVKVVGAGRVPGFVRIKQPGMDEITVMESELYY